MLEQAIIVTTYLLRQFQLLPLTMTLGGFKIYPNSKKKKKYPNSLILLSSKCGESEVM